MAQIRGNQRNSSTRLGLSASFRDDGMNWGRIEVSWWVRTKLPENEQLVGCPTSSLSKVHQLVSWHS